MLHVYHYKHMYDPFFSDWLTIEAKKGNESMGLHWRWGNNCSLSAEMPDLPVIPWSSTEMTWQSQQITKLHNWRERVSVAWSCEQSSRNRHPVFLYRQPTSSSQKEGERRASWTASSFFSHFRCCSRKILNPRVLNEELNLPNQANTSSGVPADSCISQPY